MARIEIAKIVAGRAPPYHINVIVQIPEGGRPIKYELDKQSGALIVDRFLNTAMFYPGDCRHDQRRRFRGIGPIGDVDPFARFEIFVVAKEMHNLAAQSRRQVAMRTSTEYGCNSSTGTATIFSSGPVSSCMIKAPIGRHDRPGTTGAVPMISISTGSPSPARVCGTKP